MKGIYKILAIYLAIFSLDCNNIYSKAKHVQSNNNNNNLKTECFFKFDDNNELKETEKFNETFSKINSWEFYNDKTSDQLSELRKKLLKDYIRLILKTLNRDSRVRFVRTLLPQYQNNPFSLNPSESDINVTQLGYYFENCLNYVDFTQCCIWSNISILTKLKYYIIKLFLKSKKYISCGDLKVYSAVRKYHDTYKKLSLYYTLKDIITKLNTGTSTNLQNQNQKFKKVIKITKNQLKDKINDLNLISPKDRNAKSQILCDVCFQAIPLNNNDNLKFYWDQDDYDCCTECFLHSQGNDDRKIKSCNTCHNYAYFKGDTCPQCIK